MSQIFIAPLKCTHKRITLNENINDTQWFTLKAFSEKKMKKMNCDDERVKLFPWVEWLLGGWRWENEKKWNGDYIENVIKLNC